MTREEIVAAFVMACESLAESEDALGHLTCREIQPLLDLALALGLLELAVDLVVNHGRLDDDESDNHHDVYLAGREQRSERKAARATLRTG